MGLRGPRPTCECGTCTKCRRRAASQRWRQKTPDTQRRYRQQRETYLREYRSANRERLNEQDLARWRNDVNDERLKHTARLCVARAIKSGRLTRQSCSGCGSARAQAHHDDYSKPLDVLWLCTVCHAAKHAPEASVRV